MPSIFPNRTIIDSKKVRKINYRKLNNRIRNFPLFRFIFYLWDSLWWEYHWDSYVVFGRSSNRTRKFKSANLAILISLITLILVLIYIF